MDSLIINFGRLILNIFVLKIRVPMNHFLKLAIRSISQNDYGLCRHNLCAVLVKGKSVLSIGYNKVARNGLCSRYGFDFSQTHAEMDAILKARKVDLYGATIYVARIHRSGGIAMARPCVICQDILRDYKVRRAIYTIAPNEYGILKIEG